jgi:hypothetical protein
MHRRFRLQAYPEAQDFPRDATAEADVEWLKAMVSSLRRHPQRTGRVAGEAHRAAAGRPAPPPIARASHASTHRCASSTASSASNGSTANRRPPRPALVGELKLFVPLEGLVDLGAERTRPGQGNQARRRRTGEVDQQARQRDVRGQCAAAVVEQERTRLAEWTAQRDALVAQRARWPEARRIFRDEAVGLRHRARQQLQPRRFLAAFAVLWSHSYAITLGPQNHEPWVTWLGYTPAGVAVDVFFVTSGFLVCASLLRSGQLQGVRESARVAASSPRSS